LYFVFLTFQHLQVEQKTVNKAILGKKKKREQHYFSLSVHEVSFARGVYMIGLLGIVSVVMM